MENVTLLRRTETNVTLQWSKINNASYVLQFNGTERMIAAPDGDGPVTFTVSSLSPGTTYTFNLYSVYGSTRSTGVKLTVTTGKMTFFLIVLKEIQYKPKKHRMLMIK